MCQISKTQFTPHSLAASCPRWRRKTWLRPWPGSSRGCPECWTHPTASWLSTSQRRSKKFREIQNFWSKMGKPKCWPWSYTRQRTKWARWPRTWCRSERVHPWAAAARGRPRWSARSLWWWRRRPVTIPGRLGSCFLRRPSCSSGMKRWRGRCRPRWRRRSRWRTEF